MLVLLRKLAQSPLVRRSLPNAAAIITQYFQFKRMPGEPIIANFLVRETLGFEEFQEALLRLREELHGLTVNQQLPRAASAAMDSAARSACKASLIAGSSNSA